jgi:hypothetical protein
MKIKATAVCLAAGLVLALNPMITTAQRSGQFAIAQPNVPFAPTQAPAIATRAPFANLPPGSSPVVIIQPPVATGNPFFTPGQGLSANPGFVPNQVFAPNQVFLPNQFLPSAQGFISNQFVFPSGASPSFQPPTQVALPPTQLLIPGQTVIPTTTSQPSVSPAQAFSGFSSTDKAQAPIPMLGTSRADVVKQFGQPVVSVSTSTTETLFFSDGTKVTLQNGQVSGSK